VKEFTTDKQALDFIVGRIATEAAREGALLSEIERKMLYFSETDWTLPDMTEVNAEFDRDYDQDEYEKKIAGLIGRVIAKFKSDSTAHENWDAAIEKLSEGDRYLLVMVRLATTRNAGGGWLPSFDRTAKRPPYDVLKLLVASVGFVAVSIGLTLFAQWMRGTKLPLAAWIYDHRQVIGYLSLLIGLFVLCFWNYFRYSIRVWRERQKSRS
jgi:hypothetical protein